MQLLVAGPASGSRDLAVERLAYAVDVPAEVCEFAEAPELVRRSGAVGVVALVPSGGRLELDAVRKAIDAIRAEDPALPVVVGLEDAAARDVIALFRAGAQEVVLLEQPDERGLERIRSWIEQRATRSAGSLFPARAQMPRMLGAAPSMRETARLVERVAASDATVLILGESGTGKELVARAIHTFSKRRKGPFVAINCAAIPETLLENELFGHEKGSYTGASSTAIGKVEAAEKGTLFLDEIGEMPISLQSKILRLLQEKTYDRIGGTVPRKADIRIVTATNRDLKLEAQQGRFREDLYYRLSVVPITLPALRDRPEDVPLLARDIMRRLAESLGRPGLTISDRAIERLAAHRWPGNVRELENELERASVMAVGDEIQPEDLELRIRVDDPERAAIASWLDLDGPLADVRQAAADKAGRLRVSLALEQADGDRIQAAQALGVSEQELSDMLAALAGAED